jgi:transcriptional regulator with XRE-family HTH domain
MILQESNNWLIVSIVFSRQIIAFMEWGELIRRIRQTKGLTQENLAEDLGVDISTVIRWEKQDSLKTSQLEKIAKIFKMSVDDLYSYHAKPQLLEEPLQYYNTKKKVTILVELDGSQDNLKDWIATITKVNKLL